MGMHSEREEFYEQEERNKRLAETGRYIRSLPEHKRQEAMKTLEHAGINVYDAMHQSATHHWDPYW